MSSASAASAGSKAADMASADSFNPSRTRLRSKVLVGLLVGLPVGTILGGYNAYKGRGSFSPHVWRAIGYWTLTCGAFMGLREAIVLLRGQRENENDLANTAVAGLALGALMGPAAGLNARVILGMMASSCFLFSTAHIALFGLDVFRYQIALRRTFPHLFEYRRDQFYTSLKNMELPSWAPIYMARDGETFEQARSRQRGESDIDRQIRELETEIEARRAAKSQTAA